MTLPKRTLSGLAAVVAVCMAWTPAWAGGGHCDRCGCQDSHKVCHLVKEKKTVEVPCFSSKCDTICVGGPCRKGCKQCESKCSDGKGGCADCAACGGKGGCGNGSLLRGDRFVHQETIPSCPRQYHRKVLMRKMVKKEITVYKWVTEDMCGDCESKTPQPVVPKTAKIPAPPRTDAVIIAPRPADVIVRPASARIADDTDS